MDIKIVKDRIILDIDKNLKFEKFVLKSIYELPLTKMTFYYDFKSMKELSDFLIKEKITNITLGKFSPEAVMNHIYNSHDDY